MMNIVALGAGEAGDEARQAEEVMEKTTRRDGGAGRSEEMMTDCPRYCYFGWMDCSN